ncbi:MAG: hypothetical protein HOO96_03275 [Polyangiaceae bacterium]|nr:hypothetical protein [Polyangiaceae bacterium]
MNNVLGSVLCTLAFAAAACGNSAPPADATAQSTATTVGTAKPEASATPEVPATPAASATAAAVAAPTDKAPTATAMPTNTAECKAKNGTVELNLTWDKDMAKGTLAVDGKSKDVVAQLYKGLILVDAPGTKTLTGKVATVTTDGKKAIHLGGTTKPGLDCN